MCIVARPLNRMHYKLFAESALIFIREAFNIHEQHFVCMRTDLTLANPFRGKIHHLSVRDRQSFLRPHSHKKSSTSAGRHIVPDGLVDGVCDRFTLKNNQ